jgi:hypothetical protein
MFVMKVRVEPSGEHLILTPSTAHDREFLARWWNLAKDGRQIALDLREPREPEMSINLSVLRASRVTEVEVDALLRAIRDIPLTALQGKMILDAVGLPIDPAGRECQPVRPEPMMSTQ